MKKRLFLSSALIAVTIIASGVLAYAATSGDGIATGGFNASIVGSQTKNIAYTSTPSTIMNYSVAKFSGYSSYEKQSAVSYGYSSVTAYAPSGAFYAAYGQHAYMSGGPRVFESHT